jgi:uncharacterized surface protein with fasciclin (FAS1) repeats
MILSYILNGCAENEDICSPFLYDGDISNDIVLAVIDSKSKRKRGGDGISDDIIKTVIKSDKKELTKLINFNQQKKKKLKSKNIKTQEILFKKDNDKIVEEYTKRINNLKNFINKFNDKYLYSVRGSKSKQKSYILQKSIIQILKKNDPDPDPDPEITPEKLKKKIWGKYKTEMKSLKPSDKTIGSGDDALNTSLSETDAPFIILSILNTEEQTQKIIKNLNPKDIVDIATENPRLSTLVSALQATGLVDVLKRSEGPFTVFAPTNEAFAALPDGKLDMLLKLENQNRLKDILLYHVLPGKKLISNDFPTGETITLNMANKKDATIYESRGAYIINEANVVITDIEASNGVIHVIDNVMPTPG